MLPTIASAGLPELLALASSMTYAVTFISLRQGLRSGSPIAGVLLMDAIVGGGALAVALARGSLQALDPVALAWFAAAGCVGQGLGQMASSLGIQRLGVSRAAPIQGSTPIWAVAFSVAFLGEAPGAVGWLGTAFIVGGVALLSGGRGGEGPAPRGMRQRLRAGLVYPLAASLMFGVMPILAKFGFARQKAPMVAVGAAFTAAVFFLLASRPLLGGGGAVRADRRALRWFCLAGVCTLLSAAMTWTALSIGRVSTVMPLSRLAPLWVVVISYFFLGHLERVGGRAMGGALLVVTGGALILGSG